MTKKRGRKSAAELAVTPTIEVIPRPVAPNHLSDEEASVWETFVSSMAADYFARSDHDTLANLCRHTIAVRRISQWIEKAQTEGEEYDLADMERLYRMRERETRAANAMARSLRLTKQAQVSPKGAAGLRASPLSPPWE